MKKEKEKLFIYKAKVLKEDRVQNTRNITDGSNFKPEDENEIDKSIKHKQSDKKNKKICLEDKLISKAVWLDISKF